VTEGATVIYGAPVGRSIALVEGVVVGFTESGRVWVKVVRRAYGSWRNGKGQVHVGADRLVVVEKLPPATTETVDELRVREEEWRIERERIRDTHEIVEPHWSECRPRHCIDCGATETLATVPCPGRSVVQ
jgi:hypothetical protein